METNIILRYRGSMVERSLVMRNTAVQFCSMALFLFIHLKKCIFGILKVKDGNERALPSAVYALMKKFSILNKEELNEFIHWNKSTLYNHAKIKVGSIKTIIE